MKHNRGQLWAKSVNFFLTQLTDVQCIELRVAGLQGSAKTLERKLLVAWPGIEPGSHAYMASALTTELRYHAGQLGEETPTDDP